MFMEGNWRNPEETPAGTWENMHRSSTQTARGFKENAWQNKSYTLGKVMMPGKTSIVSNDNTKPRANTTHPGAVRLYFSCNLHSACGDKLSKSMKSI